MTKATKPENPPAEGRRTYDLAERTKKFAMQVLEFIALVSRNPTTSPLISQLVRSGTSVGANYCEADEAVSRKDFRRIIGICKKEARETKYWLELLVKAQQTLAQRARPVWQEAHELHMIFAAIYRRTPCA